MMTLQKVTLPLPPEVGRERRMMTPVD